MAGWDNMTRGMCNSPGCDKAARKGSGYYCEEHAPAKKAPAKRKATATAKDPEATAREVLVDALDKPTPTNSAKPPTLKEWDALLGPLIVLLTSTVAFRALSHRDQPDLSPEERDALNKEYERLCLSDDEAEQLAKPLTRLLASSSVNEKWGRALMNNADLLMAAWVAWDFSQRVRPYYAEKRIAKRQARQAQQIYTEGFTANGTAPAQNFAGQGGYSVDGDNPPRPPWYQPDA